MLKKETSLGLTQAGVGLNWRSYGLATSGSCDEPAELSATLSLALPLVYGLFEQLCPQEEDRSTVASLEAHRRKEVTT